MAIAVLEDHHQLGKRVVHAVLRAAGFEVLDYGPGLRAADLVSRVADDGIELLLVSTLMLRSALAVRGLKTMLAEARLPVKLIVGGAPFRLDVQLWREVGADAMGRDSSEALEIVTRFAEAD